MIELFLGSPIELQVLVLFFIVYATWTLLNS
jgi:hypothetical protein